MLGYLVICFWLKYAMHLASSFLQTIGDSYLLSSILGTFYQDMGGLVSAGPCLDTVPSPGA